MKKFTLMFFLISILVCVNAQILDVSVNALDVNKFKDVVLKVLNDPQAKIKALPITQENMKQAMKELPAQKVEEGLREFKSGHLVSSQKSVFAIALYATKEGAEKFVELEKEFLKFKDEKYKELVQKKHYNDYESPKVGKYSWIQKVLLVDGKSITAHTFISVNKQYVLEGTLIDQEHTKEKIEEMIETIWKQVLN